MALPRVAMPPVTVSAMSAMARTSVAAMSVTARPVATVTMPMTAMPDRVRQPAHRHGEQSGGAGHQRDPVKIHAQTIPLSSITDQT